MHPQNNHFPSHTVFQYGRDLDHCHHQMKHLNMLLSEKKENILSYQDQIANMRAELAQHRDETMAARAAGKQQGAPQVSCRRSSCVSV